MLEFQPLTKDNVSALVPYLVGNGARFCDFSPANLYIWAGYFYKAYAIHEDMVFFQLYTERGRIAYTVPMGNGDVKAALLHLHKYTVSQGEPLIFSLVSADDLPLLREVFGELHNAQSEREWCDYVYDAHAMAQFVGSAYSKQRNHVRRFEREYPAYRVEPLDDVHLADVEAFLEMFPVQRGKEDDFATEEIVRTKEAMRHWRDLSLMGVVLYVKDTLIGFSAGTRLQDMLFVNFEKADTRYNGVYQMLVKAFAQRYVDEGVRFINREEDCGDAGLRKSKLAYHPIALIEKYTVEIKGSERV